MLPATTAQLATVHDRLSRYVHGHFRRKLTLEDAHDAAAEALAEADRAMQAGHKIDNLDRWLRRAAWRNALDTVRRTYGEGATPREPATDIDAHAAHLAADDATDRAVVADAGAAGDAAALDRAAERLTADEQQVIRLRYFDEVPVADVLDRLGCSRHHYENLTKRALRKLRDGLIASCTGDSCRRCQTLLLAGERGPLTPALAVERDAHVHACLGCRAFSRRQRGLIAAMPAGIAVAGGSFAAQAQVGWSCIGNLVG